MEDNDPRKRKEDLLAAIERDPHQHDFFHLVRTLDALSLDREPTGYTLRPSEEDIRFGNEPVTYFTPSTLASIEVREGEEEGSKRLLRLQSYFLGLAGPNGPLPLRLTEFIYRRLHGIPDYEEDRQHGGTIREGYRPDPTLSGFLNLLEHRVLSLFYRAWADVRKVVDYDRRPRDRFRRFVGSLYGESNGHFSDEIVGSDARHFFAGHLGRQSKCPEGLESILEDFFGTKVLVTENVGHWLRLPESTVCRLGESESTGRLGDNLVIGSRYWDCQLRYRIRLGPMGWVDFQRFFPILDDKGRVSESLSRSRRGLVEWVRIYTGLEFFVDAQLVLKREEVPEIQLGMAGMLGYSTWLRDKPVRRDASGNAVWLECEPLEKDADNLMFELELEA